MSQVLQTITLDINATVTTPTGVLSNATLNFGIVPQGSNNYTPIGSSTTNSSGVISASFELQEEVPAVYTIQATFAQTSVYAAASATASVDTSASQTSTTLTVSYTLLAGDQASIIANLTSHSTPLSGETLTATLNGTTLTGIPSTDLNGESDFTIMGLVAGNNTLVVSYPGAIIYLPSSATTQISTTTPPKQISAAVGLGVVAAVVGVVGIGYVATRKKR